MSRRRKVTVLVVAALLLACGFGDAPEAVAQEAKCSIDVCDLMPRFLARAREALSKPAYTAINQLAWETGDVLFSGCEATEVEEMALALAELDFAIDTYVSRLRRWSWHPCIARETMSLHRLAGELLQMTFHSCGDAVLPELCSPFPLDTSGLDPRVLWELRASGNETMAAACDITVR